MTISELFVKLKVTGAEGASKAFSTIGKGISGIKEESLAAKAAMLGIMVGLERLTGFSSQVGMDLKKFSLMTDLSTDSLQKLQYSSMMFDVSAAETTSTVQNLQQAMKEMQTTGNAPAGFSYVASQVGMDPKRLDDTYYVLGQLQKFAKMKPAAEANQYLKGMMSSNFVQYLKGTGDQLDRLDKMGKKGISIGEINQLAKVNSAWKDIWYTLEQISHHFVAKHGMEMTGEVSAFVRGASKAAKWIDILIVKHGALKGAILVVGAALGLAFAPYTTIILGVMGLIAEITKMTEGKKNIFTDLFGEKTTKGPSKEFMTDFQKRMVAQDAAQTTAAKRPIQDAAMAAKLNVVSGGKSGGANVEMNNTYNIDGTQSPEAVMKQIEAHHQKALNNAGRQFASQTGGG